MRRPLVLLALALSLLAATGAASNAAAAPRMDERELLGESIEGRVGAAAKVLV